MQREYTLEELAKFLKRPTKELQRAAERDLLKGRKTKGTWVFALPDVAAWMEQEITRLNGNDSVHVEEITEASEEDEHASLFDMIDESIINISFSARTKSSVLSEITKMAESAGKLWDADEMTQLLREREELMSTAFESGVAILHPRRPQPDLLGENFLALAISSAGVPFGGGFQNLTDVFFLLCCRTDAAHLRSLSRLARILRTEDFLNELRACKDPYEAKLLIGNYEKELD